MAIELTMPKLSDTMEEGKILKWLVKEGDSVAAGDVVAEIETDKADMEYEVIDDGVVLKIVADEGRTVAVGEVIAYIGEAGEEVGEPSEPREKKKVASTGKKEPAKPEAKDKAIEKVQAERVAPAPTPSPPAAAGRTKASPVARRLAKEAGVALGDIPGGGPDGRVVKRDVEAFLKDGKKDLAPGRERITAPAPERPAAEAPSAAAGRREKLSSMRKTIATRMARSKAEIPHFYLTISADMAAIEGARGIIAEQEGVKLSVNDFIIKACARALEHHPLVNAHIEGDEILYHESIDIGVAVALEEGLITPVIRDCRSKSIGRIAEEISDLAERARNRKLAPEEYTGAGFTISNLGMFGIEEFAAIINPPASAILAVGRVLDVPVVSEGAVVAGKRMKMTLSCDHRVIDGAVGALFLATLKDVLEHTTRMLV